MKKIINGKRYDTTTAQGLASWSNAGGWRDFHHFEETLYRKRSGEYFLYGKGGPASKYAESCGQNQWIGGSRIIPLSVEAAKKWAEEHLDGDDYEKIFGPAPESDNKKTVSLRLTEAAAARLKDLAAEAGSSMSDVVESLIMK